MSTKRIYLVERYAASHTEICTSLNHFYPCDLFFCARIAAAYINAFLFIIFVFGKQKKKTITNPSVFNLYGHMVVKAVCICDLCTSSHQTAQYMRCVRAQDPCSVCKTLHEFKIKYILKFRSSECEIQRSQTKTEYPLCFIYIYALYVERLHVAYTHTHIKYTLRIPPPPAIHTRTHYAISCYTNTHLYFCFSYNIYSVLYYNGTVYIQRILSSVSID